LHNRSLNALIRKMYTVYKLVIMSYDRL
jgi:hypothetical protein